MGIGEKKGVGESWWGLRQKGKKKSRSVWEGKIKGESSRESRCKEKVSAAPSKALAGPRGERHQEGKALNQPAQKPW